MDAPRVGLIRDDDDPLSARSFQRCAYHIQFLGCVGDRGIQDVERLCRYTLILEHPDVEIGFPGIVKPSTFSASACARGWVSQISLAYPS